MYPNKEASFLIWTTHNLLLNHYEKKEKQLPSLPLSFGTSADEDSQRTRRTCDGDGSTIISGEKEKNWAKNSPPCNWWKWKTSAIQKLIKVEQKRDVDWMQIVGNTYMTTSLLVSAWICTKGKKNFSQQSFITSAEKQKFEKTHRPPLRRFFVMVIN